MVAYTIAWLLFLLFILLGGYVLTKGALWSDQHAALPALGLIPDLVAAH